ncbi:NIPSNAP family protein [Paraburkholderia sp.]|uniref:NIPSNAP family protein n=1 Tax=Paraburkholderia sp. TaxID=1926495 RepID=UPI00239204EE|nr:NIPSNAP family protein [Paraburkholderia sp.]MDE1179904.1 NIPSNAP family protein [Paraburkholderia sp.]
MITCYLRYIIDARKLKEFEAYGKMWIPLVERFGGTHHGYFLPGEGANNVALALFSFPGLAAYETYRTDSLTDPECQAAFRYAEETGCIISYERSFFRPVFD